MSGVVGDQLPPSDTASVAAVARRVGADWHAGQLTDPNLR